MPEPREDLVRNVFVVGLLAAVFGGMIAGPAIGATLAMLAIFDSVYLIAGF